MIIWNSSSFPALYSSCSELNHKKIQYCSSSGLSRLCSSFLDLSNFLISGKSSNEKKPETRNSWNEEFPETRKILKRGISWNEEILSHHRLLCFITNIKRNTAGLSARVIRECEASDSGWPADCTTGVSLIWSIGHFLPRCHPPPRIDGYGCVDNAAKGKGEWQGGWQGSNSCNTRLTSSKTDLEQRLVNTWTVEHFLLEVCVSFAQCDVDESTKGDYFTDEDVKDKSFLDTFHCNHFQPHLMWSQLATFRWLPESANDHN